MVNLPIFNTEMKRHRETLSFLTAMSLSKTSAILRHEESACAVVFSILSTQGNQATNKYRVFLTLIKLNEQTEINSLRRDDTDCSTLLCELYTHSVCIVVNLPIFNTEMKRHGETLS